MYCAYQQWQVGPPFCSSNCKNNDIRCCRASNFRRCDNFGVWTTRIEEISFAGPHIPSENMDQQNCTTNLRPPQGSFSSPMAPLDTTTSLSVAHQTYPKLPAKHSFQTQNTIQYSFSTIISKPNDSQDKCISFRNWSKGLTCRCHVPHEVSWSTIFSDTRWPHIWTVRIAETRHPHASPPSTLLIFTMQTWALPLGPCSCLAHLLLCLPRACTRFVHTRSVVTLRRLAQEGGLQACGREESSAAVSYLSAPPPLFPLHRLHPQPLGKLPFSHPTMLSLGNLSHIRGDVREFGICCTELLLLRSPSPPP